MTITTTQAELLEQAIHYHHYMSFGGSEGFSRSWHDKMADSLAEIATLCGVKPSVGEPDFAVELRRMFREERKP